MSISESAVKAFAEGKQCTARIPGVCSYDPGTTVWCHINSVRWGSGKGFKSPILCGFIGCRDCHDAVDGRMKKDKNGDHLDPEFVRLCAYEAHMESLYLLDQAGIT